MMTQEQKMQHQWITRRDANAFAELVQAHAAMVFSTCRRVLGDSTEAEDVAQECFMELAGASRVVKPSLGGWLYRIAVFRSRNRIRAAHRRHTRERHYAESQPNISESDWDDIQLHLDEAIAALPENYRQAVIYRFLSGQTQAEVAENLGVSRSTAQYRIERGVEEIRKKLKARGITAAAVGLVAAMDGMASAGAPPTLTAALGRRAIAAYPPGAALATSGGSLALGWIGGAVVVAALLLGGAYVAVYGGDVRRAEMEEGSPRQALVERAVVKGIGIPEGGDGVASNEAPETGGATPVLTSTEAARAVVGRVYGAENGRGLYGFEVQALSTGTKQGSAASPVATAITDGDGAYRLVDLPEGTYTLQAFDRETSYNEMEKNGADRSMAPQRGGEADDEVKVGHGTVVVDIPVETEHCLSGQVVFSDGRPAGGMAVWARGENDVLKYWATRETDPQGRFLFLGLKDGQEIYVQAGNATDVSPVVGPARIADGPLTELTVTLDSAASMEGVVVDASGSPAPYATAWLASTAAYTVHPRFLFSDELGRFAVSGLPAASYGIQLAPLKPKPANERDAYTHFYWGTIHQLYPDETASVSLTLRPAQHRGGLRLQFSATDIAGRVTDIAGRPLAEVRIGLMGGATANTDRDGRYSLQGAAEGSHVVFASHKDYRSARLDEISTGSRDVDFQLEARGQVEGQVVDGDTGAPIVEFELYTGANRPYQRSMDRWFKEHRDPEGRFSYKPNFDSERIFAHAPGYAVGSAFVTEVYAGQVPTKVRIALTRGRTVTGVVVQPGGVPVRNASIFCNVVPSYEEDRINSRLASSDGAGAFTLESLSPEDVKIVAWHPELGYGTALLSELSASDPGPIRIELAGKGGASVQISEGGEALSGVSVEAMEYATVTAENPRSGGPLTAVYGVTDDQGFCQFTDLPVGDVKLSCALGTRTRFITVAVTTGEMPTYVIQFLPLVVAFEGRVLREDGSAVERGTLTITSTSFYGAEHFHYEWAEGVFRIDGLPEGDADVMLRVDDEIPRVVPGGWHLSVGDPSTRDIVLADTNPIGRPTHPEDGVNVPLVTEGD